MAWNTLAGACALVTVALTSSHVNAPKQPYSVTIRLDPAVQYRPHKAAPPVWRSKLSPAEQERWLLTAVGWAECRGCSPEAIRAVEHVVVNRARKSGRSITDEIYAKAQFSFWWDMNREALRHVQELPSTHPDRIAWTIAKGYAVMILAGHDKDNTRGSRWYHTTACDPAWKRDRGMRVTMKLGKTIFYAKG